MITVQDIIDVLLKSEERLPSGGTTPHQTLVVRSIDLSLMSLSE
jgi:hypothetical protein